MLNYYKGNNNNVLHNKGSIVYIHVAKSVHTYKQSSHSTIRVTITDSSSQRLERAVTAMLPPPSPTSAGVWDTVDGDVVDWDVVGAVVVESMKL